VQQWQQQAMQVQAAAAQGQEMPMPPPPEQPPEAFLHDVVIERKENDGKVCISVLAPEHCYVSTDTPDWTLRDCPYFEFRQEKTIADIRAMGLDVAEDVSDDEEDTEEDDARNRYNEGTWGDEDGKGLMRRVWVRSIWVRADAGGSGCARRGAATVGARPGNAARGSLRGRAFGAGGIRVPGGTRGRGRPGSAGSTWRAGPRPPPPGRRRAAGWQRARSGRRDLASRARARGPARRVGAQVSAARR
jgi:hypothetical protein